MLTYNIQYLTQLSVDIILQVQYKHGIKAKFLYLKLRRFSSPFNECPKIYSRHLQFYISGVMRVQASRIILAIIERVFPFMGLAQACMQTLVDVVCFVSASSELWKTCREISDWCVSVQIWFEYFILHAQGLILQSYFSSSHLRMVILLAFPSFATWQHHTWMSKTAYLCDCIFTRVVLLAIIIINISKASFDTLLYPCTFVTRSFFSFLLSPLRKRWLYPTIVCTWHYYLRYLYKKILFPPYDIAVIAY